MTIDHLQGREQRKGFAIVIVSHDAFDDDDDDNDDGDDDDNDNDEDDDGDDDYNDNCPIMATAMAVTVALLNHQ